MDSLKRLLDRLPGSLRHGSLITLSVLPCGPVAFVAGLAVLAGLGRKDSFRALLLVVGIIVLLLWWPMSWMMRRLRQRIPASSIARHYPWVLGLAALLLAAGYVAWHNYAPGGYNQPRRLYDVEISSEENRPGAICLLGIETASGQSVHSGVGYASDFERSAAWSEGGGRCSDSLPAGASGHLRFQYRGQVGEMLIFLFRKMDNGGNVVIRIDGRPMAEASLYSLAASDYLVPAILDVQGRAVWEGLGVVGWGCVWSGLLLMGLALPGEMQYERGRLWAGAAKQTWDRLLERDVRLPAGLQRAWGFVEARPWTGLALLAAVLLSFFWPVQYYDSSDVAYYLSLAKNLYHGAGYVNPDLSPAIYRGPVFPLLIAGSYRLFGESFRSALIMERIFWVLTIGMVYLVGRQLYNQRTGFWAALLVLFAGVINAIFNRIWTDGPLIFLLLVVEWVCWQVYRKERGLGWYVLLGVLLGLGYLLKQTALFIVPLPLLLWLLLPENRTRKHLVRLAITYLLLACFLVGWMGYVKAEGGSPGQVTADASVGISLIAYIQRSVLAVITGKQVASTGIGLQGALLSPVDILNRYYQGDVVPYYWLPALFPITLLYLAYRSIVRRARPEIFLGLGLLLFSSLIPVEVLAQFGPRHDVFFYVVVLIAAAGMLNDLVGHSPSIRSNLLLILVAICVVYAEIELPPLNSSRDYVPSLHIFTPALFEQPVTYLSKYGNAAAWVDAHIGPEEKTLVALRDANALHALTAGNRHFELLNTCIGDTSFTPAERCAPPYIAFWITGGVTDPDTPRDLMQGISEPWLLSTINSKDIRYIIVTPAVYSLSFYLLAHPSFEEVHRQGNLVIFRVRAPVRPISNYPDVKWGTCVGQGTPEYLKNLERLSPAVYQAKLQQIFGPWMGLSAQDLNAFERWHGCEFDVGTGAFSPAP